MDPKSAFEAVDNLIKGMDQIERHNFFDHLQSNYTELGITALQGVEQTAPTDVPSRLTPEQQERAGQLTAAMAEKFGVKPEEFSVLEETQEDGQSRFTVAYTAGNGIYKGSWDDVFDKKNAADFKIKVSGKVVDTRKAMTESIYRVMVAQARANDQMLPDSHQLSTENGELWTWTLLTSERADGFGAPIADVYGGGVYRDRSTRGAANGGVRFRPAAVIE